MNDPTGAAEPHEFTNPAEGQRCEHVMPNLSWCDRHPNDPVHRPEQVRQGAETPRGSTVQVVTDEMDTSVPPTLATLRHPQRAEVRQAERCCGDRSDPDCGVYWKRCAPQRDGEAVVDDEFVRCGVDCWGPPCRGRQHYQRDGEAVDEGGVDTAGFRQRLARYGISKQLTVDLCDALDAERARSAHKSKLAADNLYQAEVERARAAELEAELDRQVRMRDAFASDMAGWQDRAEKAEAERDRWREVAELHNEEVEHLAGAEQRAAELEAERDERAKDAIRAQRGWGRALDRAEAAEAERDQALAAVQRAKEVIAGFKDIRDTCAVRKKGERCMLCSLRDALDRGAGEPSTQAGYGCQCGLGDECRQAGAGDG